MSRNETNGITVPMDTYGSTDDTASFINKDQLMMQNYTDDDEPIEIMSREDRGEKNVFFDDGKRRIDFVLVYEEEHLTEKQRRKREEKDRERREKGKKVVDTDEQHDQWRHKFLDNLKKIGLDLEEDIIEGDKKTIFYVKLHAPWDLCCFFAEELNFRAPLQESDMLPNGGAVLPQGGTMLSHGSCVLSHGAKDCLNGGAMLPQGGAMLSHGSCMLSHGAKDCLNGGAMLPQGGAMLSHGSCMLSHGAKDCLNGGAILSQGGAMLSHGSCVLSHGAKDCLNGGAMLPQGGAMLSHMEVVCCHMGQKIA
uniref:Uncharacterized protein LOC102802078 n=1 Tax=Saccoglossus kowalevskii TaxID=10224 RepID=A0ABM0LW98_SACKO|nr:PREDICTED: uncharacterized protein LOC102802078 [Saccoglossus kowalevskii]